MKDGKRYKIWQKSLIVLQLADFSFNKSYFIFCQLSFRLSEPKFNPRLEAKFAKQNVSKQVQPGQRISKHTSALTLQWKIEKKNFLIFLKKFPSVSCGIVLFPNTWDTGATAENDNERTLFPSTLSLEMRPNYELYCVFTYKKYRHSNHDCASLKINDTGISVIKFAEWRFLFLVFHEGWVNLDCCFVHTRSTCWY